jgi:GMP synthase (glutamine-hydrolysing)
VKRVVFIRHNEEPEDDRVFSFFQARGFVPDVRRPFRGEVLGEVDGGVVATVIFGGPFNVFEEDRFQFLHAENRWIEQCLKRQVPLLGICQGAQSMARVLGAKVGPQDSGVHEFGYYELEATPEGQGLFPERLVVCQAHWHGFEIPAGATRLAKSQRFENQAFSYGPRALGLQFHAEVRPDGFRRWQQAEWAPHGKPGAQSLEEQNKLMAQHDTMQAVWFQSLLERFFGEVPSN